MNQSSPWRVLIASNHPLFGQGLRSLLQERWGDQVCVLGLVRELDQTMQALDEMEPDLLIVDYDDQALNREAFLTRLIHTEHQLRVVLLSLQEGRKGSQATVYDRRTMEASRIEEWLDQGMAAGRDTPFEVGDSS